MKPVGRIAALLAASWWLVAATAAAEDAIDTKVSYEAPAGCPDRSGFERELRYRTARVHLVEGEAPEGAATVEARITKAGARWSAKLLVRDHGATTRRSFDSPQCTSLVGALALTAAVLLDPEGARTDAAPPPPSEPPAPPPEPPAPPEPPEPPAPPPEPPPPTPVPPPPATTVAPPATTAPARTWSLGIDAGGGVTTLVQGADPFASIGATLRRKVGDVRPAVGLDLRGTPGHDVARSAGVVAFVAGGADLAACPHVLDLGAELRGTVCLAAALWAVRAEAPSALVDLPTTRLLLAGGAEARLERAFGRLTLGARVSARAHAFPERFRIEPEGEVFRLPPVYVAGSLHVGATIL